MARRPYISNSSYYKLTIPEISGGVNLRDNISLIRDNQLTDCKNVWYKDGMLRTRAALRTTHFNDMSYSVNSIAAKKDITVYANEKNTRVIDGVLYFLTVVNSREKVSARYVTDNNPEKPVIEIATIADLNAKRFNVFQNGNEIFIFGSITSDSSSGILSGKLPIYKIWEENGEWKKQRMRMSDAYVPTIMHNCPPTHAEGFRELLDSRGGVMLEGFNLLGNRYKMLFNNAAEYETIQGGEVGVDEWRFNLLEDTRKCVGETVVAHITDVDGITTTHTVLISSATERNFEDHINTDGIRMTVYANHIAFWDEYENIITMPRNMFLRNCIEVEAPLPTDEENLKKVLNCTFNEWYGGGSEGLYGGMHLFLGGNFEEKHKSLVLWSDINKPLYFSENCYAYVGDKTQAVTAFSKQGELLIIAKEKEMYATKYVNNSETFTEERIQNQAVIDITTDVLFPMTQIHGFIGCDCPNTMQLCRNRLVWANSNGKVYSLASPNQYNERTIYEVSGMVERQLKQIAKEDLQDAVSADWRGYYVLMVSKKVFLMDYNSYGFASVSSYSKSEDAETYIPWWIWDIDFPELTKPKSLTSIEGKLYFSAVVFAQEEEPSAFIEFLCIDDNANEDTFPLIKGGEEYKREIISRNINTTIKTKYYDFGLPTTLKNIPKIEVSLGTNGGSPITVTAITDKGNSETEVSAENPEETPYSTGNFENKLIRPLVNRVNRIALVFSCDGDMAIDGITITYKTLGGIK